MKWIDATIARECRALERARRRFVSEPTDEHLHDVRTTGRRLRSLLEDVADLRAKPRLLARVKRAANVTDAARDSAVLLELLEKCADAQERDLAHPLMEQLRERERDATKRSRKRLERARLA